MKPAPFSYHRPTTTDEAADLLSSLGDDAKVIAGGQSLLPIMNMRLAEPSDLIDLTAVRSLRTAEVQRSSTRYGATVTHMMFEDQLVADATGGLLQHAAAGIGYRAIRTRGTLGGSLAHADSAAEWPTVMTALNARVIARSVRGRREIAVRDLLQGFFATILDPDEFIEAVDVDHLSSATWWGMHKTNKKVGEFAESMAVTIATRTDNGELSIPEIWLGAARDVPVQLTATAAAVDGQHPENLSVDDLRPLVANDIGEDPHDQDVAARHHLQLHAVTVLRALRTMRKADGDDRRDHHS